MHKQDLGLIIGLLSRVNKELSIIKAQNEILLKQIAITNNVSLDKLNNEVLEIQTKYIHEYLNHSDDIQEQAFQTAESDD